jgi:hypothetical protein
VRVVSIAPVLFFPFGVKNPLDFRRGYYLYCLLFLCVVMTCEKFYFFPSIFFLHIIAAWDNTLTHLINQIPKRRRRRRYVEAFRTSDERFADDNDDHQRHPQRYRRRD